MISNAEELFEQAFQTIPTTTDNPISNEEATPSHVESASILVDNKDAEAEHNSSICSEMHTLEYFLKGLTASRDIDSISILSNSLVALVKGMEENSIIKLYRTIGKLPTTSSRHYIKMHSTRMHSSSAGQQQRRIIKVPLHNFPNINLGTITSNNIRFHLNIFCLRSNGGHYLQGNRSAYRPFSHPERLVIVASMNLARLLQCKHLSIIHNAVDESEDLTDFNKSEIKRLLQFQKGPRDIDAPHHWVSGGDFFCLSNEHTYPIEISSRRDWAVSFLSDFELCMNLIANGILKIPEIGGKCFAASDTFVLKVSKKVTSVIDIQRSAAVLNSSKLYTLTAAGTKHDFRRFKTFNPSLITLDPESCTPEFMEYMSTINQFNRWMMEAGLFNRISLEKCFHPEEYDKEKLITTFDDAITFQCIKHDKIIISLPASNSKMKNMFRHFYSDVKEAGDDEAAQDNHVTLEDELVQDGEEENDDDEAEEMDVDELEDTDDDEETEETGDDEEAEEHDNHGDADENECKEAESSDEEDDNDNIASQDDGTGGDGTGLSSFKGQLSFAEYSILLNPTLSTYHSGRINLQKYESQSGGKAVKLVGCGTNVPIDNGDLLGCQMYITGVKNSKFATVIKNVSVLAHMDKASFGLMHPSLRAKEKYYKQRMDECLVELGNIDFSKINSSDLLSRHYCLRVETFRAYIHGKDDARTKIDNYPIDICTLGVCLVDKELLLSNYRETIDLAKKVLTNVFSGKGEGKLNPRCLSIPAKMAVQYLSEIISFDIGSPCGYARPGPIMKQLLTTDISYMYRGIHYPIQGVQLSEEESMWTNLPHGMDPRLWILFDDERDDLKNQILTSLGYIDPTGHTNANGTSHQRLVLSVSLLERVRKRLSSMLFRYQKKSKDRDLVSWFLFVSTYMSSLLPSTKNNDNEKNVFEVINFKSFAKIGSSGDTKLLEQIIQGLAKIFWECYHWEWRGDLMATKGFRHINHDVGKLEDWPRTMIAISEFIRKHDSEVLTKLKQASKTIGTVGKSFV